MKHQTNGFKDKDGFEREVVRHVETTLARSMFNCDESAAYSAVALAFRDRLILEWNRTQQRQTFADSKRVYYLSLEFLMGRALDNAMLNIGQKDTAKGQFSRCSLRWINLLMFDLQPVLPSLASASKMLFSKNMTLPWAMVVWAVSPLASSTVWLA